MELQARERILGVLHAQAEARQIGSIERVLSASVPVVVLLNGCHFGATQSEVEALHGPPRFVSAFYLGVRRRDYDAVRVLYAQSERALVIQGSKLQIGPYRFAQGDPEEKLERISGVRKTHVFRVAPGWKLEVRGNKHCEEFKFPRLPLVL